MCELVHEENESEEKRQWQTHHRPPDMDQLLSALQGAQERRPELRDTSSCFFQQVLSPRRGRRRVATWGLLAGRRVYISVPIAPLNPYAATSLSPTQLTARTSAHVQ
jgi:hypothetical protein